MCKAISSPRPRGVPGCPVSFSGSNWYIRIANPYPITGCNTELCYVNLARVPELLHDQRSALQLSNQHWPETVTVTLHSSAPCPSLYSSCRSRNKEDRLSQGTRVELLDPLYLSQGRGGPKALWFLAREVPPLSSGDGASEQCKAQHS